MVARIASIADLCDALEGFHRLAHGDPNGFRSLPQDLPPDLPPALAMLYQRFGALMERDVQRPPFATQDALLPVSRLERTDGMIVFACENQGNWTCRCQPNQPDPPVLSDAPDLWHDTPAGFQVVCESLERFLITLCLQEAVMSCQHLLCVDAKPEVALNTECEALWQNAPFVEGEPLRDFHAVRDQPVLVMQLGDVLWIGNPIAPLKTVLRDGIRAQVISP